MTTEITLLSDVTAHDRCPECGHGDVTRIARVQNTISRNGSTLWTLLERCIMCAWKTETHNVKVGA